MLNTFKNKTTSIHYWSTKNQCDHFHIYLDGYPEVPDFIKKLGNKATVINCQNKNESIRDNGKFILLEKLIKENKDGYYITCDDDIRYPADYINTMIKKLINTMIKQQLDYMVLYSQVESTSIFHQTELSIIFKNL